MTDHSARLRHGLAGRYTTEQTIGAGGMATVYAALDVKHHRRVAIKVLRPEFAAAVGPERFLREIEIAANLHHPHIVPLYDSGEAAGFLYYVMPLVEGESLRALLDRAPPPLADALLIAREIADALGYAHARGVIHRDIKPENILLEAGHAALADFGIAQVIAAAGAERLTQTGLLVGTPAYMSPEQASGDVALDGRSDLYSLGCVLYETLAGHPPHTGSTSQAILARRLTDPVPPLPGRRERVPAHVERALRVALATAPADRFATAAEFAAALVSDTAGASLAKSIAVLSFTNMSADPENEYLSDGIADEVTSALAKIEELRVASRTSAFAFKGKREDITEIGRRLRVATVLEGSVRQAGTRLRISVQLSDAANGYQLWSERYDRELEDVFIVQDDIARSIVRELRVRLTEGERHAIEKVPTTHVQAYDQYLRGRQLLHQFRKSTVESARAMFERAVEIDPGYALAHAGIADCSSFLHLLWHTSAADLALADAASRRAVKLDPEIAEARLSRAVALTLSRKEGEAGREFEVALRLDPQLFDAHYYYGRWAFQQGRLAEAAVAWERAAALRPDDYQPLVFLRMAYAKLGRRVDAQRALLRILELMEQRLELSPDDPRALALYASHLIEVGRGARAEEFIARALALEPDDAVLLYNVACFHAMNGQREEALNRLEEAMRQGWRNREWADSDYAWESLRGDARFRALLGRIE